MDYKKLLINRLIYLSLIICGGFSLTVFYVYVESLYGYNWYGLRGNEFSLGVFAQLFLFYFYIGLLGSPFLFFTLTLGFSYGKLFILGLLIMAYLSVILGFIYRKKWVSFLLFAVPVPFFCSIGNAMMSV